jgi:hypothetical protein
VDPGGGNCFTPPAGIGEVVAAEANLWPFYQFGVLMNLAISCGETSKRTL